MGGMLGGSVHADGVASDTERVKVGIAYRLYFAAGGGGSASRGCLLISRQDEQGGYLSGSHCRSVSRCIRRHFAADKVVKRRTMDRGGSDIATDQSCARSRQRIDASVETARLATSYFHLLAASIAVSTCSRHLSLVSRQAVSTCSRQTGIHSQHASPASISLPAAAAAPRGSSTCSQHLGL